MSRDLYRTLYLKRNLVSGQYYQLEQSLCSGGGGGGVPNRRGCRHPTCLGDFIRTLQSVSNTRFLRPTPSDTRLSPRSLSRRLVPTTSVPPVIGSGVPTVVPNTPESSTCRTFGFQSSTTDRPSTSSLVYGVRLCLLEVYPPEGVCSSKVRNG